MLLGCDTNDLSKSRSELMDVLLTTRCVRLTTFAQSKRGSVLRQRGNPREREIQQILVPRCQFPRFAPTGVKFDTTGVSRHAHRCQWPRFRADRCQSSCPPVSVPTFPRRPVSVATPTGVSSHAAAPTGVSGHAHRCRFPRCRADRCQWPPTCGERPFPFFPKPFPFSGPPS